MRRTLTFVLASILLAAACTSRDDPATDATTTEPTTGATGETDAPGPTGPVPGVTDTEIRIGVTFPDLEAAGVAFTHGDYQGAYEAVIDSINADGGVNGRMLVAEYAPVDPTQTASAEEACVRLTEDVDVFAVLGFFFGDAVLCYLEVHETAAIGSPMTNALLDRAKAPWFSSDASSEDSTTDAIRKFAAEGLLAGTVGVFALDDQSSFVDDAVLPLLAEEGVEPIVGIAPPAGENADVFQSIQDTLPIVRRFESDGVESVLLVGTGASTVWLNALETTDYRPQVLSTDLASFTAWAADEEAGHDLSVLDGSIASGGYGPMEAQFLEEEQQECNAIIDARRDEPTINPADWVDGEPRSWVSANAACVSLRMFVAIAEAAGDDLNYGTFQQAGENLGALKLPGNPEPFFYGPRPSLDGDPPVFLYEWDPDAEDFLIPDGA